MGQSKTRRPTFYGSISKTGTSTARESHLHLETVLLGQELDGLAGESLRCRLGCTTDQLTVHEGAVIHLLVHDDDALLHKVGLELLLIFDIAGQISNLWCELVGLVWEAAHLVALVRKLAANSR